MLRTTDRDVVAVCAQKQVQTVKTDHACVASVGTAQISIYRNKQTHATGRSGGASAALAITISGTAQRNINTFSDRYVLAAICKFNYSIQFFEFVEAALLLCFSLRAASSTINGHAEETADHKQPKTGGIHVVPFHCGAVVWLLPWK